MRHPCLLPFAVAAVATGLKRCINNIAYCVSTRFSVLKVDLVMFVYNL